VTRCLLVILISFSAFSRASAGESTQIFFGTLVAFETGAGLAAGGEPPPGSPAAEPQPIPAPDLEAFCRGKELCFLDQYYLPAGDEKVLPQFLIEMYQAFIGYGELLSKDEKSAVEKGLAGLNETELGRATCRGAAGGSCALEALAAKGIVVKAKNLGTEDAAHTLMWGGKVLVVINRNPKFANRKPLDLGVTLGHELSHAEDYKKLKLALTESYRADTELKAYLSALVVYTELKLRHPSKIKNPEFDFLIEVWDWKENKGPYPGDFYAYDKNGDKIKYRAEDFLRLYIEPARDGLAAIRNAVASYFYVAENLQWDFPKDDATHWELLKITLRRGGEYGKWRREGVPLAPLPGTGSPAPANPGGGWWHPGGGGDGTETGTGTGYPFNPNPHFQPWQ